MLEHIKAAEEKFAVNLNPMPHVLATLHAIAARIEAIGETADGEVGEEVNDLNERINSLTSAVNSLGSSVGGLVQRIEALEQAKAAPAVPPVPPQA